MVLLEEQERVAQRKLQAASAEADAEAARRRAQEDERLSKRPRTEQQLVVECLRSRLSNFRKPTDKVVPIGVKLWGSDVLSLADEHGQPRLDSSCLPFSVRTSQRNWIHEQLNACGKTPQEFWSILRSQEMCLDYALMAMRAGRVAEADDKALAAAASDIVPSAWSAWMKHRCRGASAALAGASSSAAAASVGASSSAASSASAAGNTRQAPAWELDLELPETRSSLLREVGNIHGLSQHALGLLDQPEEKLEAWLTDVHMDVAIAELKLRLGLQTGRSDIRFLLPWESEGMLVRPWLIHVDRNISAVVVPVSNAAAGKGGGSHWTAMGIAEDGSAIHVDSLNPPVASSIHKANLLLQRFAAKLVHWNLPAEVRTCSIRVQKNGVDCGIFAWLHMEAICRHLLDLPQEPLAAGNIEHQVNQRRRYMVRMCQRFCVLDRGDPSIPMAALAAPVSPAVSLASSVAASASPNVSDASNVAPAASVASSAVAPVSPAVASIGPSHAVQLPQSLRSRRVPLASPNGALSVPASASVLAASVINPGSVSISSATHEAGVGHTASAITDSVAVSVDTDVAPVHAVVAPAPALADIVVAPEEATKRTIAAPHAAPAPAEVAPLVSTDAALASAEATGVTIAAPHAVSALADAAPGPAFPDAQATERDEFLGRGEHWKLEAWTYHFTSFPCKASVRWDPKKQQFQCTSNSVRKSISLSVGGGWRETQDLCLGFLRE